MKLYSVSGKLINKTVDKYSINWEKKSRSQIQFTVKQFLKPFWFNHLVFEEFPVYGTNLKVDILNATLKIAIEVNGGQHNNFNKFFHNDSPAKYLQGIKNDMKKAKWLEKNGFQLIEIEENEISSLSKEFFVNKFNLVL